MNIITSIITIISINFIIRSFPESDVKDTGAKLITPFQRSVLQEWKKYCQKSLQHFFLSDNKWLF